MIHWKPDGSGVQIVSHPELPRGQLPEAPARVERAWIAGTHLGDDVLGRFVPGDLVKPALHYVQSTINEKLEGRASPRLLWDAKRERLGLYIVPDGLIGALWLQFARAVERDSQFRQCAECGIWFELAPGTARADKLYCSTPCRTKAYRKRQAEAARLHGEGRSIEDIARELESDPDTVRGWIEQQAWLGRIAPERDRIARAGGEVGAQTSSGIHDLDRCLAGANALAPDLMTADERLTELAQILAAGFMRLRRRESMSVAARSGDFRLDFSPERSVHATARQRRQVRR